MAKQKEKAIPEGANTASVPENLHIHRVQGDNFKVLQDIDIVLDDKGNLIPFSGPNGSGKTSLIDLIWATLGGKSVMPGKPIRAGETEMKARVTLKSGKDVVLIVTRTAKKNGDNISHSLKVTTADGSEVHSPQAMLDEIVGMFAFDPLEFCYLKDTDKTTQLLEVCGLAADLDKIESDLKELETQRRDIGRDRDKHRGAMVSLTEPDKNTPTELVDIADLTTQFDQAQMQRSKRADKQRYIETCKATIGGDVQMIEELKTKIAHYEKHKAEAEALLKKAEAELKKLPVPDIEAIQQKLQTAEATNARVREANQWRNYQREWQQASDQYEKHTQAIEKLRRQPEELLKKADLGIEGLTIVDRVIHLNGIPLDQVSTSQQLVVGVKVGMLANPMLKAMFIRDGSLLDSKNLALIAEMAKGNDYQVIYEKVDESGQVGFVLEHGRVVHEPEVVA